MKVAQPQGSSMGQRSPLWSAVVVVVVIAWLVLPTYPSDDLFSCSTIRINLRRHLTHYKRHRHHLFYRRSMLISYSEQIYNHTIITTGSVINDMCIYHHRHALFLMRRNQLQQRGREREREVVVKSNENRVQQMPRCVGGSSSAAIDSRVAVRLLRVFSTRPTPNAHIHSNPFISVGKHPICTPWGWDNEIKGGFVEALVKHVLYILSISILEAKQNNTVQHQTLRQMQDFSSSQKMDLTYASNIH